MGRIPVCYSYLKDLTLITRRFGVMLSRVVWLVVFHLLFQLITVSRLHSHMTVILHGDNHIFDRCVPLKTSL